MAKPVCSDTELNGHLCARVVELHTGCHLAFPYIEDRIHGALANNTWKEIINDDALIFSHHLLTSCGEYLGAVHLGILLNNTIDCLIV